MELNGFSCSSYATARKSLVNRMATMHAAMAWTASRGGASCLAKRRIIMKIWELYQKIRKDCCYCRKQEEQALVEVSMSLSSSLQDAVDLLWSHRFVAMDLCEDRPARLINRV